ncbi:MAG: hypothetical protein ABR611_11515 [Chthoniobacterales bacterium]
MTAAIFLLGAAVFGIGLVRCVLPSTLNHAEQVLWGLIIGWTVAAGATYGFVRIWGSLIVPALLVVTALLWLGAVVAWLPTIRRIAQDGYNLRSFGWKQSYTPLVILLGVFAAVYACLFATHMLQVKADGGIYSGGESTYYDMAYHAAITNSFVHGANLPPIYTPMPPAPLLYPFLPDFLTALLVAMGMSLHSALVWTAVPLCVALTGVFYFLALRLIKLGGTSGERVAVWSAAVAALLFFLNGGLGFIDFFQDWRASGTTFGQFIANLHVNYSHLPDRSLVWPNIITDMLLPQRTSIFGLSLGLIVITCFAISWECDTKRWGDWRELLVAGVVAGLLPYFHVHTYIAVGLVGAILFFLQPRCVWLLFWLPALILALPRLLQFLDLPTTGFARFQPGWRGQGEPSWPLFWFRNVGLPTVLIIPAWLSASRSLRRFYLPFVALLGLALLVVISPNDYDNLKLMTYWYAATAILIAAWIGRLARRRIGLMFAVAFVAVSIFAGALAIFAESQSSRLMFGREERAAADFVKANTAPHSLFLTAPSLHQPILSLAGRRVVRGPTAWLWSHGYPFAEREADVRAIYAGRDDALGLLRYYRVDYIYLGPNETAELHASRDFFDANLPVAYKADAITIYDARQLTSDGGAVSLKYPPREYGARVDRDPSQFLDEFPVVAYDLYLLHTVAFGRVPRYQEFVPDLQKLGRNLYLHLSGWEQTLAENKKALEDDLTKRPDFKERYDAMGGAQYVAALATNGGFAMSEQEQAKLSEELAAGRETRVSILRRISADPRLAAREYNFAYVLCHYFSYLKRNPDTSPDYDLTGFNFWREQLDRTRDYRGVTRAFLESDEYKRQDSRATSSR